MKRYAAASALVILLAVLSAHAAFGAETGEKRMNLDLRDVPFPEVIRQIFSGSKNSYSVDPALNDLKVSATLKNVTRDQAIAVITKTAGVKCSLENGAYTFRAEPQVLNVEKGPAQSPGPVAARGPVRVGLIALHYISAGDAAALLSASPPDGLLSITASSVNTLMVKGDADAIDQSEKLIKLFDVEAALPRSIRVTVSLEVNGAGLNNPIKLATESVGPEGSPMTLGINFSGGKTGGCMLDLKLTPTILVDGSVSLAGSGGIDCNLPGVGPESQRLSKLFEAAVSATPGTPVAIASGSADMGAATAEFAISATVEVEKNRVVVPKGGLSASGSGAMPGRAAPSTPQLAGGANKPDEAHRKSADALLEQIWRAEPGQPKFDAIDAVVLRYNEGDMATRNAIAWLCVTYMKDKSRGMLGRWPCCYVISRSGRQQGVPDLIDVLLHDPAEIMRAVAAEALGGLPDNAAAHDAMLQAARTETSKQVRDTLARYLGSDMPAAPDAGPGS